MAFKLFFLAAVVAAANAGLIAQPGYGYSPLAYAAPVAKVVAPLAYAAPAYAAPAYAKAAKYEEYSKPQYNFAYDVQDGLTGDSKSQQESRDGDVVQGSYSLIDADGYKRTVDYTADDHNGFNAVVRREPLGQAVKVAAPVAYTAPIAKYAVPQVYAAPAPVVKYAAPLSYAAPVAKYAVPQVYAAPAPVVKYAAPLSYAAPVAKYAVPQVYAAPAPVVKYAAPLSYAAPVAKYAVPQVYSAPSYYH